MTTAIATPLDPAPPARAGDRRARLVEFLLIGGATLVLFPLAWLCRRVVGLDAAELAVGFSTFHAAHVINDPHFAVTYVLFYKDARNRAFGDALGGAQRIRYLVAGIAVPVALAVWASVALVTQDPATMGWMIQLMFFLVGWHYVKQGFGVLTVLSARRGVRFSPLERAVILSHCFTGWAHAWSSRAHAGTPVQEKGVLFTSFGPPPGLARAAQIAFFLSALPLVWVLVRKWRAEARRVPLAPLCGLLVTVWAWVVYSGIDPLMKYVIPALHSVQYLYFVWLLKRNEARAAEGPPAFGPPPRVRLAILAATAIGLGWLLLRGAPSLLDGVLYSSARKVPRYGLGPTPFLAAFYVFVNIHHYFMDHVIWRRDNPETRYLRSS